MRFIVQGSASMDRYALDCHEHRLDACILRRRSPVRAASSPSDKFDACSGGCYHHNAGWSSLVARWAHNPKVGGSNPPPATNFKPFSLRCLAWLFIAPRIPPFWVHWVEQQDQAPLCLRPNVGIQPLDRCVNTCRLYAKTSAQPQFVQVCWSAPFRSIVTRECLNA